MLGYKQFVGLSTILIMGLMRTYQLSTYAHWWGVTNCAVLFVYRQILANGEQFCSCLHMHNVRPFLKINVNNVVVLFVYITNIVVK